MEGEPDLITKVLKAKSLLGTLSLYWQRIIGTSPEFTLEERIYHAICILGIAAVAYNIPFNFFIKLPVSGWLSVVIFTALIFLYFLSRFKRRTPISFILASFLINTLLAINFFYNSGIAGPTLILFALIFFLTMAVAPKNRYFVWTLVNITLVLSLLTA